MNERIQQLIEQATTTQGATRYNPLTHQVFDSEKFAQLIVAHASECVRDVLRDEQSDLSYASATQVQNRIKQYFGVEL